MRSRFVLLMTVTLSISSGRTIYERNGHLTETVGSCKIDSRLTELSSFPFSLQAAVAEGGRLFFSSWRLLAL